MMILLFIVAGVVLAYLLETHLEGGSTKVFKPQNWFGRAPTGSWTYATRGRASEITTYLGIIGVLLSMWLATNVPSMRFVGLSYMGFLTLWIIVWVAEIIKPELMWTADIDVGSLDKWGKGFVLGGLVGAVLFAFANLKSLQLVNLTMMKGMKPMLIFATTVLLAPLAETGFFNGTILPTVVEDFGIIPGVLFVGILFAGFHLFAYSANTLALMIAFAFMVATGLLTLYQRAFIGAWFAHIIFNLLTFFAWMGAI